MGTVIFSILPHRSHPKKARFRTLEEEHSTTHLQTIFYAVGAVLLFHLMAGSIILAMHMETKWLFALAIISGLYAFICLFKAYARSIDHLNWSRLLEAQRAVGQRT